MDLQALVLVLTCTVGCISLFKILITIFKWIWVAFLRPLKNLKSYGSWALITGSTDGIGKALALELASKGLNVVLVGRNPLKLKCTSNHIHDRYGTNVQVKSIVIDFSTDIGDEIVSKIKSETQGIDIGILVNNAGMGHPYARYFHEVDLELMDSIIRVNMEGLTYVSKAVLPGMLKRNKGAIVNIGSGSVSAVPSYPLYSTYAATKAYVETFSRSISLEYKHQGIDVQCQIPLVVATKLTSIQKTSIFAPSPELYSRASVRWIGYEPICIPFWSHSPQWSVLRAFPDELLNLFLLKYFLGVRRRGQLNDSMKREQEFMTENCAALRTEAS